MTIKTGKNRFEFTNALSDTLTISVDDGKFSVEIANPYAHFAHGVTAELTVDRKVIEKLRLWLTDVT